MSDFSNAVEWDPGVVRASRVASDGGASAGAFDLVVRNLGRETTLRYVATTREPRQVMFSASTPRFDSVDTITVTPRPGGSIVDYSASVGLRGVARIFAPLVGLAFRRIGNRARLGLTQRLGEPSA